MPVVPRMQQVGVINDAAAVARICNPPIFFYIAGQQIGAAPTRYRSFLEVLTNYIVQKQRESQNEELEYNVVYVSHTV